MRIATLFSGIGAPEQGAKRVYGDELEMIFDQIDKAEAGHTTNTLMDFAI